MSDALAAELPSSGSAVFNVLSFGSCSAHEPVYDLDKRGRARAVWLKLGHRETSYTHTPGEFIQLTRFLRGELDIGKELRRFIFHDFDVKPNVAMKAAFDSADLALVELCTCDSIVFNGYFLHRNLLVARIVNPILALDVDDRVKRATRIWYHALVNKDDAKQYESAKQLLLHLPEEIRDETTVSVLLEAKVLREERSELNESLSAFSELLGKPMGYLIHYRNFMPDGRPISWPPKFRTDLLNIANDRGVPVFDPMAIIKKHGFARAVQDDLVHYRRDFIPVLGSEYLEFIDTIKSRYRIEAATAPSSTGLVDVHDAANPSNNDKTSPERGGPGIPAATQTVPVDALVAEVDRMLVALHRRRMDDLGIEQSGLFAHYASLLDRGAILRAGETRSFDLICHRLPPFSEYAVLRAGLGQLALLLAKGGRHATAYEAQPGRFQALTAGIAELRRSDPLAALRVRGESALLPLRMSQRPQLAIATEFIINSELERDEAFCHGISSFDAILVQPRAFIRLRNSPSEQREAVAFLRSLGFTHVTDFAELGLVYLSRGVSDSSIPTA